MIKVKTQIKKIGKHSLYIRIPSTMKLDSQFPFKEEDNLILEVVENFLIIKKEDAEDGEEISS